MFKLGIKNWDEMCFDYLKKIRYFNYRIEAFDEYMKTKSCFVFYFIFRYMNRV